MPYTEQQKRNILINAGYNPDEYTYDETTKEVYPRSVYDDAPSKPLAPALPTKPITSPALTRGQAAGAVFKRSIIPTLGAGLAAAPFTGGSSLLLPLGAAIIGGLGTSYGQEKLLEAFQSPENYKAGAEKVAQAREQFPYQSLAVEAVPGFGLGGLSRQGIRAGGKLLAGKILDQGEKQAVKLGATMAGVGAGLDAGSQVFIEPGDKPYDPLRTLLAGGFGVLQSKPQLLGRTKAFGYREPIKAIDTGIRPDIPEIQGPPDLRVPFTPKEDRTRSFGSGVLVDQRPGMDLPTAARPDIRAAADESVARVANQREAHLPPVEVANQAVTEIPGFTPRPRQFFQKINPALQSNAQVTEPHLRSSVIPGAGSNETIGQRNTTSGASIPILGQKNPLRSQLEVAATRAGMPGAVIPEGVKPPIKIKEVNLIDQSQPTSKIVSAPERNVRKPLDVKVVESSVGYGSKGVSPKSATIHNPNINKIETTKPVDQPQPTGKLTPVSVEIKPINKPKPPTIEYVNKEQFLQAGEGHIKFNQELDKQIQSGFIDEDRADILRNIFYNSDDVQLGNVKTGQASSFTGSHYTPSAKNIALESGYLRRVQQAAPDHVFFSDPRQEPVRVFIHEFGHHSYFNVLTEIERSVFRKVFNDLQMAGIASKTNTGEQFFKQGLSNRDGSAQYYSKNVEEFAAESFAEYVLSEKKLVPDERLRTILGRIYKAFVDGIQKVLNRNRGFEHQSTLAPLYEKMLKMGDIKLGAEPSSSSSQQQLKPLPPHYKVTIQQPLMENGVALTKPYVQVDFVDNGINTRSSNPEQLVKEGYDIPTSEELLSKLPQGSYSVGEAIGAVRDGGDSKLGSEPQPKTIEELKESNQEIHNILIAPAIDKVEMINTPAAKIAAPAMREFYAINRALKGEFITEANKVLLKDITPLNSPVDWVKQDNKRNQKAWLALNADSDFGHHNDIALNSEEQEVYDAIRALLVKSRQMQIGRGIPVQGKGGKFRQAGLDPTYFPHRADKEALNTLLNNPGTPEANKLKQSFIEYRVSHAGQTEVDAHKQFQDFLDAHSGKHTDISSQFGAIDKAEGLGLPLSMREKNLVVSVNGYLKRVARRFAYFDAIESKPEVRAALGIKHDVNGNETPSFPQIENVASHKDVKAVMRDIAGDRTQQELRREALSGIVRAAMLGLKTGAVDFTTNLSAGTHYFAPQQITGSLKYAFQNFSKNMENSFRTGVNTYNIGTLETSVNALNEMVSGLNRFRDIVNVVQLRNHFERWTRTIAFGKGKYVALDNINHFAGGGNDKQRARFMDTYGPKDWRSRVNDISEAEINETAAKYVEDVQGTYDYRQLPVAAVEGTLAPFLSLSRWNIAQANRFTKNVLNPALKGDIKPLLMSLFSPIIGGVAVMELREQLDAGHKSRIPQVKEILATNPENYKAWFYKAAALTDAAGYMGLIGNLLKMSGDVMYKNPKQGFTNPLIEGLSDTANLVSDAAEAFNDGDFELGLDTASKILENYAQTYRILMSHLNPENKENINRANEGRDLRVFKQLTDRPVNRIEGKQPNIFRNKDVRKFKQSSDPSESVSLLQQKILPQYLSDHKKQNNPELLQKRLRGLKGIPTTSFPSPESSPVEFSQYRQFLDQTQGSLNQSNRLSSYLRQRELNRAKARAVPNL